MSPPGSQPRPDGSPGTSKLSTTLPSGVIAWTCPANMSENQKSPSRQRGPSGNIRPLMPRVDSKSVCRSPFLSKPQPHSHEAPDLVRYLLILRRAAEAAMGHALEHVQFGRDAMPAERPVKAHRVRQEEVARARL